MTDGKHEPKPLYTIGIDQAVDGDSLTATATFEWTKEGKARLLSWMRGIAPQMTALKTGEGTILILPPNKK